MLNKDIKFSVKFDVDQENFNKQIEQMRQKESQMRAPAAAASSHVETMDRLKKMGIGPGASPADRQKAADTEKRVQENTEKYNERLAKGYQKAVEVLEKKKKLLAEENAALQKNLDLNERIARVSNKTNLEKQVAIGQMATRTLASKIEENTPADRQGFTGKYGWAEKAEALKQQKLQNTQDSAAAAATIAGMVLKSANFLNEIPTAQLRNQATVASNTYGQLSGSAAQGGLSTDFFWAQERVKAKDMADAKVDHSKLIAGTALLAGLGIMGAIGAAPFTGGASLTTLPALTGMAGAGLAIGGAGALANGYINGGYEAQKAQEMQSNLQNEKSLQPFRQSGREMFMGNLMRDVGMMRQLGTSEDQYRNMLVNGTEMGFSSDRTLSMMRDIQSSGGSTDMQRNGSVLSNLYARNNNLTNSGSMLGTLSRSMNFGQSDQAFIKIMSEGVKIGLNSSEFAEEQRKFGQAVTGIVGSMGLTNSESAGIVARGIAAGAEGQLNPAGIAASAEAYGKLNAAQYSGQGIQGVRLARAMNSDKFLSKIKDPYLKTDLMNRPIEEVLSDPMMMAKLSQETGASKEDLTDSLYGLRSKTAGDSLGKAAQATKELSSLKKSFEARKAAGKTTPKEESEYNQRVLSLQYDISTAETYNQNISGNTAAQRKANVLATIDRVNKTKANASGFDLGATPGGAANTEEASRATQEGTVLKTGNEMADEFEESAKKATEFAKSFASAVSKLSQAIKKGDKPGMESARAGLESLSEKSGLSSLQPKTSPASENPSTNQYDK